MQLVRLKRRLAEIKEILDRQAAKDPVTTTLTERELDDLIKKTDEAIDAAEKIGLGHHAIVEVLNRI